MKCQLIQETRETGKMKHFCWDRWWSLKIETHAMFYVFCRFLWMKWSDEMWMEWSGACQCHTMKRQNLAKNDFFYQHNRMDKLMALQINSQRICISRVNFLKIHPQTSNNNKYIYITLAQRLWLDTDGFGMDAMKK